MGSEVVRSWATPQAILARYKLLYMERDMLGPTDCGPGSRLALERAMRRLGPEGGTIGVLHVLDQHLIAQIQALVPDVGEPQRWARLRQQAEAHDANLVAGLAWATVTVEPLMIDGIPFLKRVQLAHEALVGFQGRGGADGVQRDFCHALFLETLVFQ